MLTWSRNGQADPLDALQTCLLLQRLRWALGTLPHLSHWDQELSWGLPVSSWKAGGVTPYQPWYVEKQIGWNWYKSRVISAANWFQTCCPQASGLSNKMSWMEQTRDGAWIGRGASQYFRGEGGGRSRGNTVVWSPFGATCVRLVQHVIGRSKKISFFVWDILHKLGYTGI